MISKYINQNINNDIKKNNNKPIIKSFDGLKAICVFIIFYWHSNNVYKPQMDLGARCCEILFLISGFLVAYNHKKTSICCWQELLQESLIILIKKLKMFYPLHLITFLIKFLFERKTLLITLLNIFMFHVWSNDINIYFSYNGLSWFVADLLFCYSVFPIYINIYKFNKKITNKNKHKISFAIILIIRILLEVLTINETINISIHTFPIIRLLEFLIGAESFMVFYNPVKDFFIKKGNKTSYAQILFLILYVFLSFLNLKERYIYVIAFCPILLLCSFDNGIMKKIFGQKIFNIISKIEYEFYMIHQIIIYYIGGNRYFLLLNPYIVMVSNFVICIVISYLVKKISKLISKNYLT